MKTDQPKNYNGWGGARENAGAPPKDPLLKKSQIGLALPTWLVEKIDNLEGKSRAEKIEKAFCQIHGWKPPKN